MEMAKVKTEDCYHSLLDIIGETPDLSTFIQLTPLAEEISKFNSSHLIQLLIEREILANDINDVELSPSFIVNQAYEAILLFSKEYLEICSSIFQAIGRADKLLLHSPLGISPEEYKTRYSKTLDSYYSVFGVTAPGKYWPEGGFHSINDLPPTRRESRGRSSKAVEQLDLHSGQVVRRYESQSEACLMMKIPQIYVSECCRGHRTHCHGFKWRFLDESSASPHEGDNDVNLEWVPLKQLLEKRLAHADDFGFKPNKRMSKADIQRRLSECISQENEGGRSALKAYGGGGGRRGTKAVEQLDIETGQVLRRYCSQSKAAYAMQMSQSAISQCCRGLLAASRGFRWRVVELSELEEDDESKYTSIQELRNRKQEYDLQCAQVPSLQDMDVATGILEQRDLQLNLLRRYSSLADAVITLKVSQRALQRCIAHLDSHAYGFVWSQYTGPKIEDLDADNEEEGRVPLFQLQTAIEEYKENIQGEEDEYAIPPAHSIRRKGPIDEDEYEEDPDLDTENINRRYQISGQAISIEQIDLETGAVVRSYRSQSAAANALGVSQSTISMCCRGKLHSAYGFGWRNSYKEDIDESQYVPVDELAKMVRVHLTSFPTPKRKRMTMSASFLEDLEPPPPRVRHADSRDPDSSFMQHKLIQLSQGVEIPSVESANGGNDDSDNDEIQSIDSHIIPSPATISYKESFHRMDISVSSVVEQLHVQSEMVLRRYADTATAADAMKTKHGNILNCCEGRSKTAVGFKWRFYQGPPIADLNQDNNMKGRLPINELIIIRNKTLKVVRRKPVSDFFSSPPIPVDAGLSSSSNGSITPMMVIVRDIVGNEMRFQVKSNTVLTKVFDTYAEREGKSADSLKFSLNGVYINPNQTAANIHLTDGCIVDVCDEFANEDPITIIMQDGTGDELKLKMKRNVLMKKVFDAYSARRGVLGGTLSFRYNEKIIMHHETPLLLNISNNDEIEVIRTT